MHPITSAAFLLLRVPMGPDALKKAMPCRHNETALYAFGMSRKRANWKAGPYPQGGE